MYYNINSDNYPIPRPFRLRLSNGLTITNPSEEQLLENGWVPAPPEPTITYPQRLEWVNQTWVLRDPNDIEIAQQWETIQARCKELLTATDYKVVKATELAAVNSTTIAQELSVNVITYRQALRDIYNNINNIDPFFVQWPTLEENLNGN